MVVVVASHASMAGHVALLRAPQRTPCGSSKREVVSKCSGVAGISRISSRPLRGSALRETWEKTTASQPLPKSSQMIPASADNNTDSVQCQAYAHGAV